MAHRTILLIDYEPRSIERFRQPLTDAGYSVEVATDGVTGIEAFHRLNPDMVLVEAMIPKRHGFEVCQELKRTPHGKRTPVLITTGVYKGRKYRTQALHIYGCDEYIEKPIAPEQLLAVVGKFFTGSSAATSGGGSLEPREAAGVAASEPPAPAKMISTEPSPTRAPIKPPSRNSIVNDFTEEEIMARLDAILPGELFPAAPVEAPEPIASLPVAAPIPEMPSEPASPAAHEVDDPFAQMQAELTAELGSMSAALALEPAPLFDPLPQSFPSDQAAAPSLLESLPAKGEEATPSEASAAAPSETAPAIETPGQLVNFDAGRSRRKKKGKAAAAPAPKAATPPARVMPIAESVRPQADPPAPARAPAPMTLPHGTLAEAELAGKPARRGIPAWVWAALAIAGLAAAYFLFLRPNASGPEPSLTANESAPSAPPRAPGPATEPPASETKQPLLNAIEPLQPRPAPAASVPAETRPATSSSTASAETTATVLTSKPAAVDPAPPSKARTKLAGPAAGSAISSWKPAPEQAPIAAPSGADEGVTSVESVVESPAAPPAPAPTVAAGSLIEAAELDTAPVSLSRKVPIYSMQARQLRIQGTVIMKVLVNERGTVEDVSLVQGVPGADVNDAAMRAARSWTYRPATKGGVAVKTWKVEQVTFKM